MKYIPALSGLTLAGLRAALSSYPPFRARQIYRWICSGASSFAEMRNLPEEMRNELAANFRLFPGSAKQELEDSDGTIKLRFTLDDGAVIEGVILADGKGRKTACLSTQAGCPMGCVFCKTGALGYARNLCAGEIAWQYLALLKRDREISNIVIMGMGEPLLNLDELRKALGFFCDKEGLNISKRRITLSTCGIAGGIIDLANNGPDIRLALSLTSAREELRQALMPASRENPLPLLKDALCHYQKKTGRRVTLEMVLLGGINSSEADADAAAAFARGLEAVINLIPWNPADDGSGKRLEFEGRALCPPSPSETAGFAAALERRGLKVTRRIGKGRGISGACGQLGSLPD